MKIGVVSDIHCNAVALRSALDRLAPRVDEVFVAGDAVYEYRFSSEVVHMLKEGKFPYILGNHEMVLLSPAGDRARSAPTVVEDDLLFMSERPLRIDCQLGGRSITMVHASPWAPYDRYLNEDNPEWDRCAELDADILITGHTHVPMMKRVGRTLIVNPGSIGESREPGASHLVSYAEIDLDSGEAEIFHLDNPLIGGPASVSR